MWLIPLYSHVLAWTFIEFTGNKPRFLQLFVKTIKLWSTIEEPGGRNWYLQFGFLEGTKSLDLQFPHIYLIFGLSVAILFVHCQESADVFYAFSADSENRPISGCLELDSHALNAVILSMKCKKSVVSNIYLCSEKRVVQFYPSMLECQEVYDSFVKLYGEHTLATDPYEEWP